MTNTKTFFIKKIGHLSIIAPGKSITTKVELALSLIKKVDQIEYKKLRDRLRIIFITNKNGYTNEFFMPEKIWFTNKSMIIKNDVAWIASLILHEAFHATQFRNGKYILPFGEQLEKPALLLQEKFLSKVNKIQERPLRSKDIKTALRKRYWKIMDADKKSFSHFRNLLQLFENKSIRIKQIL